MKITNKILHNLKESVDSAADADYADFNEQIDFLVNDEKEAINGYRKALDLLNNRMTNNQNNEIRKVLTHIIEEEEEHIVELNALRDKIEKDKE